MSDPACPPLPDDGVLLHIGMHKTGTTALQTLLAARRDELARRGIAYPGIRADHHLPARSLLQVDVGPLGADKAPPPEVWSRLAEEVRSGAGRFVVSSEFLSSASDEQAERSVADLGRGRVHVLLAVRNSVESAVSTWQQTLKQGRTSTIEQWANTVVPRAGAAPRNSDFWEHWDLGAVVRRWSAAAGGAGNVTVVVLDRSDRNRLLRTVEQLLELPEGFLSAMSSPASNRGMTVREAELVRRLNLALRGTLAWPDYRRAVRHGAIRSMIETVSPPKDDPRPALPGWAATEVRASGERAAAEIAAAGVRVIGDLTRLHAEDDVPRPTAAPPADAPHRQRRRRDPGRDPRRPGRTGRRRPARAIGRAAPDRGRPGRPPRHSARRLLTATSARPRSCRAGGGRR